MARRVWGRSGLRRLHETAVSVTHRTESVGSTSQPIGRNLTDAGIDIRVTRHRCKLGWLVETVLRWGGTVPTRKFLAPQLNALAQVGL